MLRRSNTCGIVVWPDQFPLLLAFVSASLWHAFSVLNASDCTHLHRLIAHITVIGGLH